MQECLLTLVVRPDVESIFMDWLIECKEIRGFTSLRVYGHGNDESILSPAEQVEGREWQVMFMIKMSQENADTLVHKIRQELGHLGIEYWIQPISDSGKIETKTPR